MPQPVRLLILAADPAQAQPILAALKSGQPLPPGLAWEVVADAPERARLSAALAEQQVKMKAQTRELSARLSEREENTRRRLAHELHDRVGQSVTALSLNLNLLRGRLKSNDSPDLAERIDRCQALVDEMALQVRDVLVELRPPVLDDHGLLAALKWYGAHWAAQSSLPVHVAGRELEQRLPLVVETALFRIAQAALHNIVRHAGASAVTLTLEQLPEAARLTIADDGRGFSPQRPRGLDERPRWGLITMRERAESVGATMRIESAPGQGTRIILDVVR